MVDERGLVAAAAIVRSAHPDLDDAALTAVFSQEYEPAFCNGVPVAVFVTTIVWIDVR